MSINALYKTFKTNTDLEKVGVLLNYGKNSKGKDMCIRVARAGGSNTRYAKVFDALAKPYRRMIQNESLDPAIAEKILREVYAKTVVLGWENMEDEEGNDLAFTEANVIQLFTDLPDLFKDVQEQATKMALFRADALEEEAKN